MIKIMIINNHLAHPSGNVTSLMSKSSKLQQYEEYKI